VREATQTIPIMFVVVSDPVGGGFVTNLARPGGNITGFQNFETAIGGKWLQVALWNIFLLLIAVKIETAVPWQHRQSLLWCQMAT
jgi:hypothetical protein